MRITWSGKGVNGSLYKPRLLIECGLDASKIDDEAMERIAGNLADSFLQNIVAELAEAAEGLTGDNKDDE